MKVLVVGNSSADLDSLVSSICYAYLYNAYYNTNICFPFIDIPSKELRLRKDVTHVLHKFDIDQSLIFFQDDLLHRESTQDLKLIYVDHNSSQNSSLLTNEVMLIIDHHADEGLFKSAEPRIIETCGSCASLVFNYWYQLVCHSSKREQLSDIFSPIADLILAPILMDTSNMTQKVEKPDLSAVNGIKEFASLNVTCFFQEIHQQKLNIQGLSVYELLQKDYKNIESPAIGFSSLAKPFKYILANNAKGEELLFVKDVDQFVTDHKLKALIMMTSYEEPEFEREISFYIKGQGLESILVPQLEQLLKLKLKLKIAGDLQIYQQLNIKESRKQVLPLVKSLVSK